MSEEEKIKNIIEILELSKNEIENNEDITATLDLQDLKSLKNLYDLYNKYNNKYKELMLGLPEFPQHSHDKKITANDIIRKSIDLQKELRQEKEKNRIMEAEFERLENIEDDTAQLKLLLKKEKEKNEKQEKVIDEMAKVIADLSESLDLEGKSVNEEFENIEMTKKYFYRKVENNE